MSLTNIIKLVSPGKLYLLLHHPDSIGYVAAFAHKVNGLKSFFIHHADHNPTLGATLHYEKHLDTTKEYALKCNELNCDNCHVLPLYVKDKGPRTPNFTDKIVNFASVGSHNKFIFEGSLDHAARVINCLKFVSDSQFYHIGPLEESSLKKINLALFENGIKSERFKYINSVPSLWKAFLELDTHVLIGSAPLGGGRAAIEAQGAGIPVLWYEHNIKSVYEADELSWHDHKSLDNAILKVMENYFKYSKNARKFYENYYNEKRFKESLGFKIEEF